METISSRPWGRIDRRGARVRRGLAGLVAAVLVLVASACDPYHPVLVDKLNNADAAAAWLVANAEANGAGYTAGNEADLIFALASTYGDEQVARDALVRLEAKTPTYVFPTASYTNYGGLAKVMLAVQTLRGDVNDFAGYDLEAVLRAGMLTEGVNAGRFTNTTPFTQPLAIAALDRTEGGVPAIAGDWLVSKQCADGGFSWGACTQADSDHTGIALQALYAVDEPAARDAAIGWLLDHQSTDGGFHASNSPDVSNANSTGLAVAALRGGSGSHDAQTVLDAITAGADYIAGIQYTEGADAGAIPWQATVASSIFLATTQGVFAWGSGPIQSVAFPKVVGEACPDETGVTVVLDFTGFNNQVVLACAEGPQESGWAALENAGFELGSVPGFEGGAICTIDGLPSGGYPECWYQGFWSYWHSGETIDASQWEFSNLGAANRVPPEGSFEGWRYEPDLYNHWAAAPRVAPVR